MTSTYWRPELGTPPLRMRLLPVHRGYPVPWFVAWQNGEPDFRVMDGGKFARALRERLCWICGEPLGRYLAFVIGPMCAVSRTTSEPPCHQECARWSAQHCPFLARPHARRRPDGFPDDAHAAAGMPIDRNPGVACVWTTHGFHVFRAHAGRQGYLIRIGMPVEVEWFAEGRPATRAEVEYSIDSGFPALLDAVAMEPTPDRQVLARAELDKARTAVAAWWPA